MIDAELTIRPVEEDDEAAFIAAGKSAFDPITGMGMATGDVNLAAILDGEVVGGFIAALHESSRGEMMGVVRWLFVTEGARGVGVGGQLVEAGLQAIRDAGARWIFSDILGENTSSAGLVVAAGGRQFSLAQQVRAVGVMGTFRVWSELGHWYDLGYFIHGWADEEANQPPAAYRSGELWLSSLFCVIVASLAAWRAGHAVIWVTAAALLLLITREVVIRGLARAQGLSLRHAAWDSSVPIAVALAAGLGIYFPIVGGLYPRDGEWKARKERRRRGVAALGAAAAIAGWGVVAWWAVQTQVWPGAEAVLFIAVPMLLFGAILATPPFSAFDASRLREWSLPAWVVAAGVGVVFLFL